MKLFGRKSDVAVIGYGSWATALIGLLTKKGKSVCWHVRNLEILETVRNEGGDILDIQDAACPEGTTFTVKEPTQDIVGRETDNLRHQGPAARRIYERFPVSYL